MFEKITDFDGKQFLNLWGGFSCECFVDGINTFVMFYIKDEEVLSLSGNDANDILDFVLSEYYENENSTIEDGFSTWLMGYYDNVIPTFDKVEPKFKVGDWVLYSGDYYEGVRHITKIDENGYYINRNGLPHGIIPFNHEICMRLWTIQDVKDGDVLAFYGEYKGNKMVQVGIIEKYVGKHGGCSNTFKIYVGVNWDNNLQMGKYMGCSDIRPATKEQCDTLMKAMADAGWEFDFEKKELKEIVRQNTANKEAEIEDTLTTDDIPLSVLYKILLKEWKRQDKIIERQRKEIKKLKDKIVKYSIKNYEMRKQLERYGITTEKGENLHKIITDLNRAVQKRNDKINKLQMIISELLSSV